MRFGAIFLAGTASATCMHNLSKFKREAGQVEVKKFGYTGMVGPFNWAALAAPNEACNTGKNQSPINIDEAKITKATEKPVINIPNEPVEFENLGTTIEVVMNGSTSFGGKEFALKQFHFHTPSEHRIGEEHFPLEMHMVHEDKANPDSITVIGLLFDLTTGPADPLLASIFPHLESIATPGSAVEIAGGVDMSSLVSLIDDEGTSLFQYTGSLTTPPCAEDVTFLIASKPLKIDVATYNSIKSIVKFNSRFTQNELGQENIIMMGSKSKFDPAAPVLEVEGEAKVTVAPELSEPTPTAWMTVTEMSGEAMATPIVAAVIPRRR